MKDRLLKRLGEILSDDKTRKRFLSVLLRWFRRALTVASLSYILVLISAIFLFECIGEKNVTLAFFLYLPRVIFLLPLLALLPVVLLFHWRLSFPLILASLVYLYSGMGYRLAGAPNAKPSQSGITLNVMTYNRGQHANQSLQPFKNAMSPDILALQEATGRSARYAKAEGYEEFTSTTDIGEFTLLSKYPILSSTLVEIPSNKKSSSPAARFEIDFSGTRIALYCIHFISPRDTLVSYRRGAFLYGILGIPGTPWAQKREFHQEYWDNRIDQAREMAQIIAQDPLPTLVVGDFNAPAGGHIHQLFCNQLADTHNEVGQGFGYSFPGTTRNPLSGGGPWLRIDYLFCNADWEPVWHVTEPARSSQHRAVTSQFRLIKSR